MTGIKKRRSTSQRPPLLRGFCNVPTQGRRSAWGPIRGVVECCGLAMSRHRLPPSALGAAHQRLVERGAEAPASFPLAFPTFSACMVMNVILWWISSWISIPCMGSTLPPPSSQSPGLQLLMLDCTFTGCVLPGDLLPEGAMLLHAGEQVGLGFWCSRDGEGRGGLYLLGPGIAMEQTGTEALSAFMRTQLHSPCKRKPSLSNRI